MPWIPFYATPQDLPVLMGLLGDDLAVILRDGETGWRASLERPLLEDRSKTAIWHVPSGPLPLMGGLVAKPGGMVDVADAGQVPDPWAGWVESFQGEDPNRPFFGASDSGIFWLHLRMAASDPDSRCGLSSFGWSGAGYPDGAPRVTVNRWAKLRRQIAKVAQKVPRGGLNSQWPPEIWAFENALRDLDVADMNPG